MRFFHSKNSKQDFELNNDDKVTPQQSKEWSSDYNYQEVPMDDDNGGSKMINRKVNKYFNNMLQAGDHVIRWKWLGRCYPFQIHGIVLSSNAELITIVDCGLSANPEDHENNQQTASSDNSNQPSSTPSSPQQSTATTSVEHRKKRLVLLTYCTDDPKLQQWHKVNYDPPPSKLPKTSSYQQQLTSTSTVNDSSNHHGKEQHNNGNHNDSTTGTDKDKLVKEYTSFFFWRKKEQDEEVTLDTANNTNVDIVADHAKNSPVLKCSNSPKNQNDSKKKKKKVLLMPKSDPTAIVLARIRFLLLWNRDYDDDDDDDDSSKDVLPVHHILFANSECIAVWCKTGTFSTLQASVFLHSTAVGQAKSVSTLAMYLSGQTVAVTTTAPASGITGWLFGATTTSTTQVGLLSTQPWILPLLAGYTILAIGTPYLILFQCKQKWKTATQTLNDTFWQTYADPSIYVAAIQHYNPSLSYNKITLSTPKE